MLTSRLFIALGAFAIAGWAQPPAGVAGPVAGFIFGETTGALRPMLGIPGAAYLGDAVATGIQSAAVSPDGTAALAVQPAGKLMLYTGLRTTTPVSSTIAGGILGVDHFAWAPDARAVAVYASASRQAQTIAGLPQSPVGGPPIDLSSLPGQPTAWVFDGQRLILAVSGGIYVAGPSAAPQRIAAAAAPSALTLAGGNLYFADPDTQQIWQVQNYAASPAAVIFAHDSGISSPIGLQVSADGQRLFVANSGNRKLAIYDIPSQSAVQSVDLAFTPTRLERFGDASVFLMNGSGSGPLYVVKDGGAGNAAVYFVPVPVQKRPVKPPVRRM